MRLLIIVLILGGVFIFILQNLTPIPLVFLNMPIPLQLPLGLWVLLFTIAGILTSLSWQLLTDISRNRTSRSYQTDSVRPRPRSVDRTAELPDNQPGYRSSSSSNRPSQPELDWEIRNSEDWDVNAPFSDVRAKRENLKDNLSEQEEKNYEIKQEPETTSNSDSVYSAGYRQSSHRQTNQSDGVYDANYRVIRPPYQEPQDTSRHEDDEDWV